jgi:hypothetical protein
MRLEVSQLSAFIFYVSFVVYPELVEGYGRAAIKVEKTKPFQDLKTRLKI